VRFVAAIDEIARFDSAHKVELPRARPWRELELRKTATLEITQGRLVIGALGARQAAWSLQLRVRTPLRGRCSCGRRNRPQTRRPHRHDRPSARKLAGILLPSGATVRRTSSARRRRRSWTERAPRRLSRAEIATVPVSPRARRPDCDPPTDTAYAPRARMLDCEARRCCPCSRSRKPRTMVTHAICGASHIMLGTGRAALHLACCSNDRAAFEEAPPARIGVPRRCVRLTATDRRSGAFSLSAS